MHAGDRGGRRKDDGPESEKRISKIHGFLSQRDIKALLKQTNYSRREMYVLYVRFKALCSMSPFSHGIDKQTFKTGVARLAVEDDLFVDRVFDLVDEVGSIMLLCLSKVNMRWFRMDPDALNGPSSWRRWPRWRRAIRARR